MVFSLWWGHKYGFTFFGYNAWMKNKQEHMADRWFDVNCLKVISISMLLSDCKLKKKTKTFHKGK